MSRDVSDLVGLVYRTDWKRLSLSATISRTFDPEVARRLAERKAALLRRRMGPFPAAQRAPRVEVPEGGPVHAERHLLTAPAGRYRLDGRHHGLDICDGERTWRISRGVAHVERWPRPASYFYGLLTPFYGLLTPQWLIAWYELQVVGSELAGNRTAIRVTGVPRTPWTQRHGRYELLDRVEVLVDAELGILLRSRQVFEGQTRESAELRGLVINPPEAAEPGQFVPPPGVPATEDAEPFAGFEPPSSAGWEVAGTVGGLPAPLEGIFGPDSVWEALGERAAEDRRVHRVVRLSARIPGQYRLDYLSGDLEKRYKAIACDRQHTTKLFNDRVTTGPVKPLDPSFALMLDPAWLLVGWRLAVIGPVSVAGRDGIHLRAVSAQPAENTPFNLPTRNDLVLDTELGILLRKTTYFSDRPATRTELRDLRPLDDSTSFRIVPAPGMRSTTDSGGPFGDRNLPRPPEAAATAATLAAAGAVAFTGWLEKHRARRPRP